MTQRRFQQIDVFASGPLNGNPLAVVHQVDRKSSA
jgi:predicted PhzF superfamily epimerase YddE/YHI9